MNGSNASAGLGASALLCLPLAAPLAAQVADRAATAAQETAFRRGLRRIHENMARGRFASCGRDLSRLLARHRRRGYAFVRKAELLEDFRRCAFFAKYPAPRAAESLSGKLVRYDPSTGAIRLEYTPRDLGDFAEPEAPENSRRKLRWHPATWRGSYTIELSGRAYRETIHPIDRTHEIRLGCNLHVCRNAASHLEIAFGNQLGPLGKRPAQVVTWTTSEHAEIARKESPARLGAPFELRIEVGRRRVRAYFGNKLLFRTKRTGGGAGQFAIEGTGFDRLVVRGTVDPGWIQDRIDHRRQLQLDEFDRDYTGDEIPRWLVEGALPTRRSFNPAQAWPKDATERHYPILSDIVAFFERGEYAYGLEYLATLDRDVLPPNTRAYLFARFYTELDEIDKAVRQCERLVAGDPEFLTGRQLRAELRVRAGQGEQAAITDYRKMLAAHPNARELYVDLAVLLIQAGRAKEAETVLERAVRATGNGAELMALQRMLVCVTRGPRWAKTFEHRSANYVVKSNIDPAICKTAASILERARANYETIFGRSVRRPKEPYRVYLFAGRTGYERFCSDILGERDTHTAGLYSAALKQLLIWNLPDKTEMLRTIRHEGFHQYLDSLVHDAPAWMNEGLAEYFEAARGDSSRSPAGPTSAGATARRGANHVRHDHLLLLKQRGLIPTQRFVHMPSRTFYRGSGEHYAQAWATVHLLRHGPERWRALLPALLRELAAGKSPKTAVNLAFRSTDLAALHRDLEAWVQGLK